MARTHLTKNQVSYPYNSAYADAVKAKFDDFDHSVDALEAGTTATVVTIHPVRGASTANVANLASFTVANDGITLVAGDRVLLKNQSTVAQNGIYVVGTVGGGTAALTRATDWDEAAEGLAEAIEKSLKMVDGLSPDQLIERRYKKFRAMGVFE